METLITNKRKHREHNQTLTSKRRRRSDSLPAAAGPRWLILNSSIDIEGGNSSVADAQTTAASSCTSSSKPFSISFGLASPPACCRFHFDWLGGGTISSTDGKHSMSEPEDVRIIAGHDDAVLIKVSVSYSEERRGVPLTSMFDYFLYEAGCGALPPSLSLLPRCYIPMQMQSRYMPSPRSFRLDTENSGILHSGEDDLLVVCLFEKTDLSVLRMGREWIVRKVPILEHREGSSKMEPWFSCCFPIQATVPIGNRYLCWVDYSTGFILCDMADDKNPKLRYVPLPATQHDGYCGHWPDYMWAHYTLGAAGPDVVRFVSVGPPRCCLGDDPGKTSCQRSSSSFSVTTWTTTLSMEGATMWVKDIVLHCDKIWKWRLPNYGCLPRDKHLEYPIVSSNDPDMIYFKVESMVVAINTRSKKLLSVVHNAWWYQRSRPGGRITSFINC